MRPGRRNALLVGGVALAAAGAGVLFRALSHSTGPPSLVSAPFPDLQGTPRRLTDWKGKVLLCNFWATWCAPCLEEIPLFVAAKRRHSDLGIVGIGLDQADNMRAFAVKFHMNYPLLVADARGIDLMRELGNQAGALPYTVVFDARGSVVERKTGAFRRDELEQVLSRLLG